MIILNHASLPDRMYSILQRKDQQFLRLIQADIALLERAEVSNIVMPCNTAHRFFDDIQAMTTIPIVNLDRIKRSRVAILYRRLGRARASVHYVVRREDQAHARQKLFIEKHEHRSHT
ncbi:aspartate/glutamate racemase family protein [Paenibacillus sp. VMFN-D1]|uniref:aspartate/glutamate racemase family protein n=1 Tax=Paenibacillus sp. VMFN-D1 TaxID=2135608 RepID=UPI002161972B|nr:aspartate/glutamate racemase family protein [Paenibacillus sp. VMFN-D1]